MGVINTPPKSTEAGLSTIFVSSVAKNCVGRCLVRGNTITTKFVPVCQHTTFIIGSALVFCSCLYKKEKRFSTSCLVSDSITIA